MKKEKKYVQKKYMTLVTVLLWISILVMLGVFWKRWIIWIGLGLFVAANIFSAAVCSCPYCGSRRAIRTLYSNAPIKRCPDCKRELHVK